MSIINDPEEVEKDALLSMVDFTGRRVLEVGCGDGRLTLRYADKAAHVTAIDPEEQGIADARINLPNQLSARLIFEQTTIENFTKPIHDPGFDIAIYSWSLWWIEPEGMVHALKHTHSMLDPNGLLINIQPIPATSLIEIHSANSIMKVDWLTDQTEFTSENAALNAVSQAISDGYFVFEDERNFDFRIYADSLPEFQEVLTFWWESTDRIDQTIQKLDELCQSVSQTARLMLWVPSRMVKLRVASQLTTK